MMSSFHERYADRGARQYVILGAGLATFAKRGPEIASRLQSSKLTRLALRAGSAGA
jgi:O-methyltransferase involved in polyketide biosynthesis